MREMKNSEVAWIGDVPENWETIPNKYLMRKVKAICPKYSNEDVLSLTMNGVIKRDLDNPFGKMPSTFDGYQFVYAGNLLMCLFDIDVTPRCIGLIENDGITSPAYSQFELKRNAFNRYYYYYYLYLDNKKELLHLAKNLRHSFTEEQFGQISTVVPPIEQQHLIANQLDFVCKKVEDLISNQEQQIEKLKQYKQSLITEVVTKGLNPDVPMKDSGVKWIGQIPEKWNLTSVRYIGSLQNGISKSGEAFGTGYPFVCYGDIYKNYELPTMVAGLVETNEKEREQYSVEYGDVFFTRTSETIEEVGFSCVCKQTISNATFAGFVIRMRPYKADEKILTNFAKYYFRGSQIRAYLVKEMNLVTRASLGQTLLKGMFVTIPPKEEQQQIATYLDNKCAKIDRLIAIKQEKIDKLNDYKKSLIYEYVTGKREVR